VGDYTRRLALELQRHGHAAVTLALNDGGIAGDLLYGDNELRLSRALPWRVRLRKAQEFLAESQPTVLSLQYVGYGFNRHALPFGLAAKLLKIAHGVPWHVMFHELWIEPEIGWQRNLLSRLQRAHLIYFCRALKPALIHTSNASYVSRLKSAGIYAEKLPIFSNIPCSPSDPLLRGQLLEKISSADFPESHWILVFFGTIHPLWDSELFLRRVSSTARASGKEILFVSVGKNPPTGREIWRRMEENAPAFCRFLQLGEQDSEAVSRLLQSADFGVATTPSSLFGKSGSFAAMVSHGLPVIAPRFDGPPGLGDSVDQSIIRLDSGLEKALENPIRPGNYTGPDEVALSLCQQLQLALQ
jgi:glycosyltransferase involved in cell wall biosynthesis